MKQHQTLWLIAAGLGVSLPATAAQMITVKNDALLQETLKAQSTSVVPMETGFSEVKRVVLPNGKVKVRYQQTYMGLPVFNTSVVATQNKTSQSEVHGIMMQGISGDVTTPSPALDAKQAISAAKNAFKRKSLVESDAPIENTKSELMVWLDESNTAKVVYMVDFFVAAQVPQRPFYFIDANTGEVLKHWRGLNHAQAAGTGPYGNEKRVNTTLVLTIMAL